MTQDNFFRHILKKEEFLLLYTYSKFLLHSLLFFIIKWHISKQAYPYLSQTKLPKKSRKTYSQTKITKINTNLIKTKKDPL